ncbi:MAG: M14 family zinc carboxypeptidase [Candidatus Delongbacteria bacterium]
MWALRIFDKNSSRDLRPEFKYTSTMHGDEVVGMELCMELIYDIIDGYYAENDTMKYIVENTDLYILPLHNPDGNYYNSRYNAKGYDLNRSFPEGVYYETDTVNETEVPEVAAMIDWNKERNFVLSANFHGGALVANYLYDKDFGVASGNYAACPDDAHVTWLAYNYASRNQPMFSSTSFPDGITNGSEWYSIDGGMQDWNYRYHNDIDITLEVSNTKWPSYSTIPSFWSDNRSSMLWYIMAVHRGIKGKVTSSLTGTPVEARISVGGIDKDYYTIPSTGEYYRILKPGSYSLTVEAEGFSTASLTDIVVKDSLATVLNIELDSVCSIGQGNSLPQGVSLHQNYPNPFNPETSIGFTVEKTSNLSLTVYNKKGESVQVLTDKKHTPVDYLYRFNGKKFSAGEYYYELKDQNGAKDTKKMLMLK